MRTNNLLIVVGHTGSGKSAIIQHIALKYREQGWVVKPLYSFEEIHPAYKTRDFEKYKTIFVFNDPIGKESFDDILNCKWKHYRETLILLLKDAKFLLSCRKSVFFDQGVDDFFKEKGKIIDIEKSDIRLSKEEKILMLKRYSLLEQHTHEEIVKLLEIEMCFPLLCKLCRASSQDAKNRLSIFLKLEEILTTEINSFRYRDKKKYCALVCLVLFNGNLCMADLEGNNRLFSASLHLCELPLFTLHSNILKELQSLNGFFVKNVKNNNSYNFYDDFIMEVTTHVLGCEHPAVIIRYADISFLRKRVRLGKSETYERYKIMISDDIIIDELVTRLFEELLGEQFIEVVLNPCLKEEKVIFGLKTRIESNEGNLKMMIN